MGKALGITLFVFGAAAGSVPTWYLTKKKYEKIAQEEIDSVKKTRRAEIKFVDDTSITPKEEKEYSDIVNNQGYLKYTGSSNNKGKDKTVIEQSERPYVISPDEVGELEDYETVSLTYYADEVLADEQDHMIEDLEGTVGEESLSHFGEYEDDSVYVRNDRLKCDFEILRDERFFYSDVQV